jgi:hypothetical protein
MHGHDLQSIILLFFEYLVLPKISKMPDLNVDPMVQELYDECHASDSIPLKDVERRTANNLTARAITAIMSHRGARCCKRQYLYSDRNCNPSISMRCLALNLKVYHLQG